MVFLSAFLMNESNWLTIGLTVAIGLKPLSNGLSMVHATYVRKKPLSGFPTVGNVGPIVWNVCYSAKSMKSVKK